MTCIPTRTVTGLATALLLTLPLAACDSGTTEDPTTPPASPTSEEATEDPVTNAPGQTPEETIRSFFVAADAAAAEGWQDTSYNDVFLTPDLAEKAKRDDDANAETGAIITGEREISEVTVLEENDTDAVVEFCNDSSGQEATKDGEPAEIEGGTGERIGRFTLTRESAQDPWLISEKGFYDKGTSCDDHFAQYDD